MLLIATRNPHKIARLREIIGDTEGTLTLDEAGISGEFDEKGTTLLEIARKKAEFYSRQSKLRTISTDGGVAIPALKGWNPVLTRRFGGDSASDAERIALLLKMTSELKGEERKIAWAESVAIAEMGLTIFSYESQGDEGILETKFDPKKYRPGLWVCSLWHYPKFGKNYFDLTETELKDAETSWKKIDEAVRKFLASGNDPV